MASESAYPELTTLKVVHNGIARRVKIPYDMDWKDFERKVCRLFNLPPPLITSYKDSMGVSVLVDNSEDFFFFLDEEYTGRLDIVISDLPESSDWTVVRTDTGKALKEADDPSEISVDGVHAINSPQTISTRGSTIEYPLFNSKELHELKSNYAQSEKEDSESSRLNLDKCLTEFVGKDQSFHESKNPSLIIEDVGSIYEDSEEKLIKEITEDNLPSNSNKSDLVTVEDEEKIQNVCNEQLFSNENVLREIPFNSSISTVNHISGSESLDERSFKIDSPKEEEPINRVELIDFESSLIKEMRSDCSFVSSGTNLGFIRDIDSEILLNEIPSNTALNKDLVEVKDSVSNISKVASTRDPSIDISFENRNKAVESNEPVSIASASELIDRGDHNGLSTSPEPLGQFETVTQIQDLRQLCFRHGDTFRRNPSLLTTLELFTDQLVHGVPIDISVLEEGLNRLSSSELNVSPSEAFEELAKNLAGSVTQLIQHVGNTFSSFIERDVSPLINSRSHQRTLDQDNSQNPANESSEFGKEHLKNEEANLPKEELNPVKECNPHHSRRHHCQRHKDQMNNFNFRSGEAGDVSICKEKSLRGKFRQHSHPRRHVRDNWLGSSSQSENCGGSKTNLKATDEKEILESSKEFFDSKNNPNISINQTPMQERIRPVSLVPSPQIIPYYINNGELHSENNENNTQISLSNNENNTQKSLSNNDHTLANTSFERKPQPYHYSQSFKPYRPLSFSDSIEVCPFSDLPSTDGMSLNHRIQICPPKLLDINEIDKEKSLDLGAEIDPADVALIEGLVTLRSMGFHDDSANLEALQKKLTVEQAVDYLLSR